jgi:5-methylcytosine-specific restriction endonuclease McrA
MKGSTKGDRSTKRYAAWRAEVFKRDGHRCRTCGNGSCRIEAHHVKTWALYPSLRYEVSNGVTLCQKCHTKIHNKRPSGVQPPPARHGRANSRASKAYQKTTARRSPVLPMRKKVLPKGIAGRKAGR